MYTDETFQPQDLYSQHKRKDAEYLSKSYPKGSSQLVSYAVSEVVNKKPEYSDLPLKDEHVVVRSEIAQLLKDKRQDRAEARRRQYMEDRFLPAVELVVRATSPDQVLNSEYAIRELDKYAIPTILNSSGSGYTAAYIRNRYAAHLGGDQTSFSDATVTEKMRTINRLMDDGRNREALSIAKVIKDAVDKGANIASDPDYELLNRIVAYYGSRA